MSDDAGKLGYLVIGLILGAFVSWAYFVKYPEASGNKYFVKAIKSHHPYALQNSQTTLILYNKGRSGHVKEVLCQFPPNTDISNLERVEVKGISQKYAFGVVGYFCDVVRQ